MSTDASDQRDFAPLLVDVRDIVGTTPRRPGSHYKFAPSGNSLAIEVEGKPYVDRAAMSARATISTATVDRVGDLLIPKGCNLKNYVNNPVVLWGHGLEGINVPVGTSQDPDGNLAITITDDEVVGTCFFSQKSLEASQIFELIDEGIVRATSVRETPMKAKLSRDKSGREILVVEEWELEEWSWCAIGVNPDAVAKAIHKGKLAGKKIHASIMKSLKAVAPPKQTQGVGFTETKSMADDEKKPPEETPADEQQKPDPKDGDGDDSGEQPYSQKAVVGVHSKLGAVCKSIKKAMGKSGNLVEHTDAREGLNAVHDACKDQMTALEGLHSKCYPKSQALKSDDMEGGDDSGGDDAEMKAFFAASTVGRLQLDGIASHLKSMVDDKNILPGQRRLLATISDGLNRLSTQAKSYKAKPVEAAKPAVSPEEQAKLDAAFAKLNAS